MKIIFKIFLAFFLTTLATACNPGSYRERGSIMYYGYHQEKLNNDSYKIEYRAYHEYPLRKCIDFAAITAAKVSLENDKESFSLDKFDVFRLYEKSLKETTLAAKIAVVAIKPSLSTPRSLFFTPSNAAENSTYIANRTGYAIFEISLTKTKNSVSACGTCNLVHNKYQEDFKKNFCRCTATEQQMKEAKEFLNKIYDRYNQSYLDRVFPAMPSSFDNRDIQDDLNNNAKKYRDK